MRRRCPGRSPQITVVRAQSSVESVPTSTRPGTSTSWSMPAAMSSSLDLVRCSNRALRSACSCCTASSGWSSLAETRGSPEDTGTSSLATSSDCTVTRVNWPTASTTYSRAATPRWANDTSRVEVTFTSCPAGERQCACRASVPARRSSTRSWASSSP